MTSSSRLYSSLLERLEGRPYGHYFAAWCPWDKHKTPALLVFDDGMVKCLSCNKIWTHEQLDRKIGKHFIPTQRSDAVSRLLPQWRKWEERYGSLEEIVEFAHKSLKKHKQFQSYLKERKIDGYIEEGYFGYLDGWITFPVFDSLHNISNIIVRSTQSTGNVRYVVSPNDSHSDLYVPSFQRLREESTVYVVYGVIDSWSLYSCGLASVTGATGKSLSPELLKPLGKRLIIVPDDGEEKEAHKLANKLGWRAKVKRINWPDQCKDTDDIRRLYGNEALLSALA